MSLLKKLAGETAIYGLSSIIGRTLNFLLLPLYVYIFPPEEYGIVSNLYAYVAFALILLTYGMETAFFRFSKKCGDSRRVFNVTTSSILITSLIFLVLLVAFLKPLSAAMGYVGQERFVLWLAIIVAIDAVTATPFTYLRMQNKAIRFAAIKLINIGLNIGFNLLFFLVLRKSNFNNPETFLGSLYNPEIGIGYVFVSNLIANIAMILLLLPEFKMFRFTVDVKLLRNMLAYALPILVVGLAGQINQNIDKILLKYLVPEGQDPMHQIGVYGANYKLAVLMTMFVQAFNYAFEPFFFSRDNNQKNNQMYADIMKYFVIFGWVIFLGITLYIDLFKHLISPMYYEGLKVVPIVLIANLLLGVYYNQSVWYKTIDKTKYGAYQSLIGSAVTLIINILFIPLYGYMASAVACCVCFFVMVVMSYIWGKKYNYIPYNLRIIGLYSGIALVFYFASQIIPYPSLTLRLIGNTIIFIIYFYIVFRKEVKPLLMARKK